MPNIKYVPETPNPKVAIFEIGADLLHPNFSKVVIAKGSKLVDFSPLAQQIYSRGTDLTRIDFFHSGENQTTISYSRKALAWDERQIVVIKNFQEEFFRRNEPALMVQALAQNVQAHAPFNHGNHPVKSLVQRSFVAQVNPVLAKDNGAMELMGVEVRADGQIFADVTMIGACNGCDSSTMSTLRGATKRINEVLDALKGDERYKANPNVQALKFMEIRTIEMPDLVLSR